MGRCHGNGRGQINSKENSLLPDVQWFGLKEVVKLGQHNVCEKFVLAGTDFGVHEGEAN